VACDRLLHLGALVSGIISALVLERLALRLLIWVEAELGCVVVDVAHL